MKRHFRHPVNVAHVEHASFGERIADRVVAVIGSWRFIGLQGAVTATWMLLNLAAWLQHWDPYPWILLNLMYSLQAGLTGPMILLASKRSDAHARALAEHTALEAEKGDQQTLAIMKELRRNTSETLRIVRHLGIEDSVPNDTDPGGITPRVEGE